MPPAQPPTYGRIFARFLLVFLLMAALLCAGAGFYLTRPPAGQALFTRQQGFVQGATFAQTITGHNEFIRAPDGSIVLGQPFGETASPPLRRGDIVGSAAFEIGQIMMGSPGFHRVAWALTVSNIRPTAAGPAATDERAWRAIVAAAFSKGGGSLRGTPPAALLRGEATGSTFRPGV